MQTCYLEHDRDWFVFVTATDSMKGVVISLQEFHYICSKSTQFQIWFNKQIRIGNKHNASVSVCKGFFTIHFSNNILFDRYTWHSKISIRIFSICNSRSFVEAHILRKIKTNEKRRLLHTRNTWCFANRCLNQTGVLFDMSYFATTQNTTQKKQQRIKFSTQQLRSNMIFTHRVQLNDFCLHL